MTISTISSNTSGQGPQWPRQRAEAKPKLGANAKPEGLEKSPEFVQEAALHFQHTFGQNPDAKTLNAATQGLEQAQVEATKKFEAGISYQDQLAQLKKNLDNKPSLKGTDKTAALAGFMMQGLLSDLIDTSISKAKEFLAKSFAKVEGELQNRPTFSFKPAKKADLSYMEEIYGVDNGD